MRYLSLANKKFAFLVLFALIFGMMSVVAQNALAQTPPSQNFPQTGFTVSDEHGFLSYWRSKGGLAIYGYPISPERQEVNPEDGKTYWTQWFERNRFEWHPENKGTKYEVLLGLLGKQLTKGRETEAPFQRVSPVPNSASLTYFPQTGHTLARGLKTYWEKFGGLEQFGYPLTEEFSERNAEDGKFYVTQWFERGRFEYHPENAAPNDILLGLLGKQALKGPTTPTPTTSPTPTTVPGNPTPTPTTPPTNPTPTPTQPPVAGGPLVTPPLPPVPIPGDASPLGLTNGEFESLKDRVAATGLSDLTFGYFISKSPPDGIVGFFRGALPNAGFKIVVESRLDETYAMSFNKGRENGIVTVSRITDGMLKIAPFQNKGLSVGDTLIFMYHGKSSPDI